jgi:hypothetical protein
MLRFIKALFQQPTPAVSAAITDPAPEEITFANRAPFALPRHISFHHGFPVVDWDAAAAWAEQGGDAADHAAAWQVVERAWLLHFRDALGSQYTLLESETSLLLSALEPGPARAALEFMGRTSARVLKVLDGIAQLPEWGKDILIVFDDEEAYYRYASYFYPEEGGEFAPSGGMYVSRGCGHFITVKADLHAVEPIIAHELTHACLDHLPIPLWLNEGLAVNTERRLTGTRPELHTPREMRHKHLAFWDARTIQQFWSGESFHRPDDGNLLSYDLARILVEHMASDWEAFTRFALAADAGDAGATAAAEHLDLDLGAAAAVLLEASEHDDWLPQPDVWTQPERRAAGLGDAPGT